MSEERSRLERETAELVMQTAYEWMKYAEFSDGTRVRCVWHDDPEGRTLHVENRNAGVEYRFMVTVAATELPPLPPLGPENDLGVFGIDDSALDAPRGQWVLRTWRDVRSRDYVRMPGTEITSGITHRLWPPTDDERGRRSWHMVAGEKHWDDHVVQPGECVVVLEGETTPRFMNPSAPVEILLTQNEESAINALGWENRC